MSSPLRSKSRVHPYIIVHTLLELNAQGVVYMYIFIMYVSRCNNCLVKNSMSHRILHQGGQIASISFTTCKALNLMLMFRQY